MFRFKNFSIKITPKSPRRHLVRLQGKLKLTKKGGKILHIHKSVFSFAIFQCTSHLPVSVADFDWSVNHVKSSI